MTWFYPTQMVDDYHPNGWLECCSDFCIPHFGGNKKTSGNPSSTLTNPRPRGLWGSACKPWEILVHFTSCWCPDHNLSGEIFDDPAPCKPFSEQQRKAPIRNSGVTLDAKFHVTRGKPKSEPIIWGWFRHYPFSMVFCRGGFFLLSSVQNPSDLFH